MKLQIKFTGKIEVNNISPFDDSLTEIDMINLFNKYADKCGFEAEDSEFNFLLE